MYDGSIDHVFCVYPGRKRGNAMRMFRSNMAAKGKACPQQVVGLRRPCQRCFFIIIPKSLYN